MKCVRTIPFSGAGNSAMWASSGSLWRSSQLGSATLRRMRHVVHDVTNAGTWASWGLVGVVWIAGAILVSRRGPAVRRRADRDLASLAGFAADPEALPAAHSGGSEPSSWTASRPCSGSLRRRRLHVQQSLDHELQAEGEALIGAAGGQVPEHRDDGRELVRGQRAELPM